MNKEKLNLEKDEVISLKIDFAFKTAMKNEKVLRGFLGAILEISPGDITNVEWKDTFLEKEHEDEKQGILDLRITILQNVNINIELQIAPFKFWDNRSMYYNFKMFVDQFKKGDRYSIFEKCIQISILDFNFSEGEKDFYSLFQLMNAKTGKIYTDKIEFHMVELKKLVNATAEEKTTALYQWAKLFSATSWEEYRMLENENEFIKEAVSEVDKINMDEAKREAYIRRKMAIMDANAEKEAAYDIGEANGIEQNKIELVKKKREKGLSNKVIAEHLEITEVEVVRLLEKIKSNS